MKRICSILLNKFGELAITYKEGGKLHCLSLYRIIREERLSKGWTIQKTVSHNHGWKKIGSFSEEV